MKKFMKGCAIAALILIVLGIVMGIVAGSIQGPVVINDTVSHVTNNRVHFNFNGFREFGIWIGDAISDVVDNVIDGELFDKDTILYELDENMNFDKEVEVYNGDVDKLNLGSDITSMDIEVGGCELRMVESGDDNFYIEAENTYKFQYYVRKGKLCVKATKSARNWSALRDCSITVYVPEGFQFEEAEIELDAGILELGDLYAKEMSLEIGAGQITADYIETSKASVSVGMGEMDIDDMQVNRLDAEVGVGTLYITADIRENAKIECSMGEVELTVKGNETDFNYNVEAAIGNIDIGRSSYSGLAREKRINNGADKAMNVECSIGNISIDFKE